MEPNIKEWDLGINKFTVKGTRTTKDEIRAHLSTASVLPGRRLLLILGYKHHLSSSLLNAQHCQALYVCINNCV